MHTRDNFNKNTPAKKIKVIRMYDSKKRKFFDLASNLNLKKKNNDNTQHDKHKNAHFLCLYFKVILSF